MLAPPKRSLPDLPADPPNSPYPPVALAAAAALSALSLGWIIEGALGALACLSGLGLFSLLLFGPRFFARLRVTNPALSPLRRLISELYDDAGIGLAIADYDGGIVMVNDTVGRLLGVDTSALVGRSAAELFLAADRPALRHAIALVVSGGSQMRELRVAPIGQPDAGVVVTIGHIRRFRRVFLSVRDASFQMRLETQIRQATKMQAVGQLAGGLAHDFNNILTAIIGTSDLLLMRHSPGSPDHDDIDQIRQNANRAANLVRQLLAFSRQQTLRSRVLKVNEIVGEISHLLRRLLGERVQLKVIHGRDLAPVRVDPGQIEQVIVNLAVNARDAMPNGGDLVLTTYALRASEVAALGHKIMPAVDYVAIAVRDTGQGIPADILDHIFEPFFTTKEVGKGTGLGLSMVYGIVKQTGGFIFAESAPGRGATFTIYLPAATGEVSEPLRPALPAPLESWGQGTILLVEDEAMVRAVAERALKRNGYEVFAASNGDDALALLENRPDIDLLISDVVMPGMDGPTLVARARDRRPTLKVLYISGYAEEQIRDRVDGEATALLRKPFSVNELSAAVRQRMAA